MFDFLAAYLTDVCPDEQRTAILDLCEQLVNMGVEGHLFQIDQTLAAADDSETSVVLQNIYLDLDSTAVAVIQELGVTMVDGTSTTMLCDVLKGLEQLTNYDDRDTVIDIIDAGMDSADTLARLLELVGQYRVDDYLNKLDDVIPGTLVRLRDLADIDEDPEELPALEVTHRARERFRKYILVHRYTLTEKVVRDGAHLGITVDSLLDQIGDTIHDLDVHGMAKEMVAVYLASNVTDEGLMEGIEQTLGDFLGEIRTTTQAVIEARELLLSVTHG